MPLTLQQQVSSKGDPLGPTLFSLVIHSLVTSIISGLNLWYLDDATIGGNVSQVFFRILEPSSTYPLLHNFHKRGWSMAKCVDTQPHCVATSY